MGDVGHEIALSLAGGLDLLGHDVEAGRQTAHLVRGGDVQLLIVVAFGYLFRGQGDVL